MAETGTARSTERGVARGGIQRQRKGSLTGCQSDRCVRARQAEGPASCAGTVGRSPHADPPRDVRSARPPAHSGASREIRQRPATRRPTAKLIDALLAAPQYGERWGRHWLDVARYADTGGYETDIYFKNAWRYRDYVVKSFNDDKPYNIFVQEQIAGDEIWPDDLALEGSFVIPPAKLRHLEARIGTGLYALGPQIHESNMDGRKILNERLTDWVDTTGAAFMGMTLGCAVVTITSSIRSRSGTITAFRRLSPAARKWKRPSSTRWKSLTGSSTIQS